MQQYALFLHMQSDCNSKMPTQNELAITMPYYEKQKHLLHI